MQSEVSQGSACSCAVLTIPQKVYPPAVRHIGTEIGFPPDFGLTVGQPAYLWGGGSGLCVVRTVVFVVICVLDVVHIRLQVG